MAPNQELLDACNVTWEGYKQKAREREVARIAALAYASDPNTPPRERQRMKCEYAFKYFRTLFCCPCCWLLPQNCICKQLPRLNPRTKVIIQMHPCEWGRSSNSGNILVHCLEGCEALLRGKEVREEHDLRADALLADPTVTTALLFPGKESITPEQLQAKADAETGGRIAVIALDGTWNNARRLRLAYPRDMLCVGLPMETALGAQKESLLRPLRKYKGDLKRVCTLEAVAALIHELENDDHTYDEMLRACQIKVNGALKQRQLEMIMQIEEGPSELAQEITENNDALKTSNRPRFPNTNPRYSRPAPGSRNQANHSSDTATGLDDENGDAADPAGELDAAAGTATGGEAVPRLRHRDRRKNKPGKFSSEAAVRLAAVGHTLDAVEESTSGVLTPEAVTGNAATGTATNDTPSPAAAEHDSAAGTAAQTPSESAPPSETAPRTAGAVNADTPATGTAPTTRTSPSLTTAPGGTGFFGSVYKAVFGGSSSSTGRKNAAWATSGSSVPSSSSGAVPGPPQRSDCLVDMCGNPAIVQRVVDEVTARVKALSVGAAASAGADKEGL